MFPLFRFLMMIFLSFSILISPNSVNAINWSKDFEMTMTIRDAGVEYVWMYRNPDTFVFEWGHRLIKGDPARQSFEELLDELTFSEDTPVETIVEQANEVGFDELERLEIKLHNGENKRKTWVWDKEI